MSCIETDVLKKEIERLKKDNEVSEDKEYAQYELDVACGYDTALDAVLSFVCDYERREKEKRQEEDDRIFQEYLDAKELEKNPLTEEQKKCNHDWYQHWTWHSGGWQECGKCGRIETFYERD
jgi:hypothetical protein